MHRDDDSDDDSDGDAMESQLDQVRALMRPVRFDDGFADRVMARLTATPIRSLADDLQRVFLRLVPLAAAAVFLLATMNLRNTRGTTERLLDRLLGISAVTTVASASSMDGDLSSWGQ